MKLVAYFRVSTTKQGQSGLGLDAQRAAVEAYASQSGGTLLRSFTEVESGKRDDRPQLTQALHLARVTGATLVIAKLDRLSRDAAFLLTLQKSGTRFVAADMPNADETTVGIMAIMAQREREAISKRTREALQAAKARGTKLGNPNGAAALFRSGGGHVAGTAAGKAAAQARAEDLRPILKHLEADGVSSLGAVADALNERGIRTPQGKQWHKSSVRNLRERLGA